MKIKIPATSANLSAGFDALGLAVALYNEVKITKSKLLSISIKGEGSDRPHLKRNNPFVSIFYETLFELTQKKENYRFEFSNNIPLARGLGSSSAVIVGAIASAYHVAKLKVDKEIILNRALAYESHPDNIAPAVYGGFTASIIEDEKVYVQKKELPNTIKSVIVIPNKPMSTAKSRTLLPNTYKKSEAVCNLAHSAFLSVAFMQERWDLLQKAAVDAMHETRRMREFPILFDVRDVSYQNGSLMSTLSGSGSTFFNLTYAKDALKLVKILKSAFPDFRVEALEFDNKGFVIENFSK